ncbi:hypothetical protein SAMN04487895_10840 [Paenibacillus sophorae]|uniref:Uncharacterized protein n=1 Tax=Paenibacillus sophorae TaxID=1333845 RepID=A0A1H8Q3I4_9BACL|nr:hypothetical protein SAMN04487895_10840 [Paenibacillus sophorae]
MNNSRARGLIGENGFDGTSYFLNNQVKRIERLHRLFLFTNEAAPVKSDITSASSCFSVILLRSTPMPAFKIPIPASLANPVSVIPGWSRRIFTFLACAAESSLSFRKIKAIRIHSPLRHAVLPYHKDNLGVSLQPAGDLGILKESALYVNDLIHTPAIKKIGHFCEEVKLWMSMCGNTTRGSM